MSFEEVNYFTVSEFYDFLQAYIGDETQKNGRRQATQEDIDRMYK